MKLPKILILLLPVFALFSCGDDNPAENTQALTIQSSLNYISATDLTDNSLSILPGADYGVSINLDRATLELYVNGLQFAPDERAISFILPELRMDYTQTGWKLDHPEAVQVETGTSTVSVSDITINFVLRVDGSQNLVSIKFTLDGRYRLTTLFTHNQFIGTTSSTDIDTPDDAPFSTEQSRYLVIIDRTAQTAEVQIAYPQFLDNMPSNLGTMKFQDIPLTFTRDGFSFRTNDLIPKIGEDPYPAFALTNISGSVVAGGSLRLSFDCGKFNRRVNFDGTAY